MKPKILNDITNIFAKWSGSKDYDPKVKYDTALEFYANEVPVLPKPKADDSGKSPVVKSDGSYELKIVGDANAVHYTPDTGKTDAQKAQARENIGAVSMSDIGTVFTFKGSVATIADLPSTNNHVGDVWFVEAELANFVWLTDETYPDGFWDEFGQPIDLSNYQMKPTIVTDLESASVTIASAADNTIYECGELTALTVTAITNNGDFIIRFTSGSTPTTTNFPATMKFPEAFAPEANTRYEINCSNGFALVTGWTTT